MNKITKFLSPVVESASRYVVLFGGKIKRNLSIVDLLNDENLEIKRAIFAVHSSAG